MIKHVLMSALLCATATASQAQSGFRAGYVIPLAGDTLRGQLDERSEQRNARLCTFRPTAGAETEYTPAQLRGYGFSSGRHYEMMALPTPVDKLEAAFLERLVQGSASLYTLQDLAGNEHFYLRTTGPLQELTQTTSLVTRDNQRYRSTDRAYQRTLGQAFQACPAMQATLANVVFGAGGLTKAVVKYNACVGSAAATVTTAGRTNKVHFRVLGGVETTTLRFNGHFVLDQQSFQDAVSPSYGVSVLFSPRVLHRGLAISLDVLYSRFTAGKSFYPVTPRSFNPEIRARFSAQHFRAPLLVRYTYPRGLVQPFIAGGIEAAYATELEGEYGYTAGTTWQPIKNDFSTRNVEQSLVGAVGLTTARLAGRNASLEVRASRSNGFSKSVGIGTSFTRFAALLVVDLTK